MDIEKTKKKYLSNLLFFICFVLGIIISVQIKNIKDNTFLYNAEAINEMKNEIARQQNDLVILEEYKIRKESELVNFDEAEDDEEVKELLKNQFIRSAMIAQNVLYSGEGLEVKVSDSTLDILSNQDPNDFIVHDQDMLRIVNDLKAAGAEIISINNQIIRTTSEIKCSGATITVNGKTFAQPFIIRAIGDKDILDAAIKSKDSYAYMISNVYGIKIESKKYDKILIDAGIKHKNYRYIKEGEH